MTCMHGYRSNTVVQTNKNEDNQFEMGRDHTSQRVFVIGNNVSNTYIVINLM